MNFTESCKMFFLAMVFLNKVCTDFKQTVLSWEEKIQRAGAHVLLLSIAIVILIYIVFCGFIST